jgi:hypothetical protein
MRARRPRSPFLDKTCVFATILGTLFHQETISANKEFGHPPASLFRRNFFLAQGLEQSKLVVVSIDLWPNSNIRLADAMARR